MTQVQFNIYILFISGGTPTYPKGKALLEFSEADSAYEIKKKKQKTDEGFDSDNKTCPNIKKKAKYHQDKWKSIQENKKEVFCIPVS